MTPKEFVTKLLPFAMQTQTKTGMSAIATLAQAALESGWGSAAPGNMYFGVKDSDGLNGNEQLVRTTEYLNRPDAKFPVVHSVVPYGKKLWKYIVSDYFRKYDTPEHCFTEHATWFTDPKRKGRYDKAWSVRHDPAAWFQALQDAKYATAIDANGVPNYASTLNKVAAMIRKCL